MTGATKTPTEPVATSDAAPEWELVHQHKHDHWMDTTVRLGVPGGWLYRSVIEVAGLLPVVSLQFVPYQEG